VPTVFKLNFSRYKASCHQQVFNKLINYEYCRGTAMLCPY
jgi:hypothetical protein